MEPVYASMQLIDQGRHFLLLDRLADLQLSCPVRILHGVQVGHCCFKCETSAAKRLMVYGLLYGRKKEQILRMLPAQARVVHTHLEKQHQQVTAGSQGAGAS